MLSGPAIAAEKFLILASTTSTQNSGLLDHILPIFTARTGIEVRVIAVGTGQALRIARAGDADAILVHHRASEDKFVASGDGVRRLDIMYNDFVLIGPNADPAGVRAAPSVTQALQRIAAHKATFASRGDDSGTHKKEQELWAKAGITPSGTWYLETGSGMGATLNLAADKNIYLLSDRGTWITFGNKRDLAILFSGDPALHNPYGYIAVDPKRHPHVNAAAAKALGDWLVSKEGQAAISDFRIDGFQAFCPNAGTLADQSHLKEACPAETD